MITLFKTFEIEERSLTGFEFELKFKIYPGSSDTWDEPGDPPECELLEDSFEKDLELWLSELRKAATTWHDDLLRDRDLDTEILEKADEEYEASLESQAERDFDDWEPVDMYPYSEKD